jgi:hypothetical protein
MTFKRWPLITLAASIVLAPLVWAFMVAAGFPLPWFLLAFVVVFGVGGNFLFGLDQRRRLLTQIKRATEAREIPPSDPEFALLTWWTQSPSTEPTARRCMRLSDVMSDVTQDGVVSGNHRRPANSGSYGWPQTLRLPSRPPKLVYLDLNQWIALAKAMSGHRDGEAYKEVLTRCLAAVDRGEAVFPISDSIYIEISKNGSHRQRRDLLNVIEPMSRFMVAMCRSIVSAHEIEAMLDRVAGPSPNPINSMDYLDWGVARAFGIVGGFKVRSSRGEDITATVRSAHPDGPAAFDSLLSNAELEQQEGHCRTCAWW